MSQSSEKVTRGAQIHPLKVRKVAKILDKIKNNLTKKTTVATADIQKAHSGLLLATVITPAPVHLVGRYRTGVSRARWV